MDISGGRGSSVKHIDEHLGAMHLVAPSAGPCTRIGVPVLGGMCAMVLGLATSGGYIVSWTSSDSLSSKYLGS